jgi:hypothetical protein
MHGLKKALRRRVLFPDDCEEVNALLGQVRRWGPRGLSCTM